MLKHLLVLAVFAISLSTSAQTKEKPWLAVGANANFLVSKGSSDAFNTGYGGNIKFGLPFKKNMAFTLTSGYTFFKGKSFPTGSVLNESLIPVRLGVQLKDASGFYLEPQAGYSLISFEKISGFSRPKSSSMFSYALNAGCNINRKLDLSAYYESNVRKNLSPQLSNVGIRLAYKFHF